MVDAMTADQISIQQNPQILNCGRNTVPGKLTTTGLPEPGQCKEVKQHPEPAHYTVPGQCPDPGQNIVTGMNTTPGQLSYVQDNCLMTPLSASQSHNSSPPYPLSLPSLDQGDFHSSNNPHTVQGSDRINSQLYKPQPNIPTSEMNVSNHGYRYTGYENARQPHCAQIKHMETYTLFSDESIRRAFVRKVYTVLTIQLLFTTGLILVFVQVTPIKHWVQRNILVYYLAFATFFIVYIALICVQSVRRTYPLNYICLIIFTLAMSYMMGTISCMHKTSSVYMAFVMTAALTACITLFAIFTKLDFTKCSAFICFISMAFFIFGIACIIYFAIYGPNKILSLVYAGVALVFFSILLCYDTQLILGGRTHEYNEEDYITAVLSLYLDVVYIFLEILTILGLTGQS